MIGLVVIRNSVLASKILVHSAALEQGIGTGHYLVDGSKGRSVENAASSGVDTILSGGIVAAPHVRNDRRIFGLLDVKRLTPFSGLDRPRGVLGRNLRVKVGAVGGIEAVRPCRHVGGGLDLPRAHGRIEAVAELVGVRRKRCVTALVAEMALGLRRCGNWITVDPRRSAVRLNVGGLIALVGLARMRANHIVRVDAVALGEVLVEGAALVIGLLERTGAVTQLLDQLCALNRRQLALTVDLVDVAFDLSPIRRRHWWP
jgi:hypothetical protein